MGNRSDGSVQRALPKGPHKLDRETVLASQRSRMFDAIIEVVAEKGYRAATVADVIARAGVSRRTFYEHFADKDACFGAALQSGFERMMVEVVTATNAGADREARITAGWRALCETLAGRPAFARVLLIAAPQAGGEIQDQYEQFLSRAAAALREFVTAARRMRPDLPAELSEQAAQAIVGAVTRLLATHLRAHDAQRLPDIVPTILGVVNALLLADIPPPAGGR
ncbi:TetR/AcrR family transcriptional regulator [Nocardia transvalensis]|uniref:TetR/AcrR family transcriptional regulator n=1 Tax=Nocardia transvalensis TaxID=37333 RepID=UPI001895B49F|nr:TetR/AcrR family transcriptional regulator [Nocardia transvalensis]MBF6331981.1 TetR/AcrR family transcriptional regulator [Nocardia transvalensis]